MYTLHYKEGAIQDFSTARMLLPPPRFETSAQDNENSNAARLNNRSWFNPLTKQGQLKEREL